MAVEAHQTCVFGFYWVQLGLCTDGDRCSLEVVLRSADQSASVVVHLDTHAQEYTIDLPESHYARHPSPVMRFSGRYRTDTTESIEAAEPSEEESPATPSPDLMERCAKRQKAD